VKANLAKQFAYLDKMLADKDYLTGKNFTVADAYLFTILNWRTNTISTFPRTKIFQPISTALAHAQK